MFPGNADALVDNRHLQVIAGYDRQRALTAPIRFDHVLGRDRNPAAMGHRFLGVDEHVAEDLHQLDLVGLHRPEMRRQIERAVDGGSSQRDARRLVENVRDPERLFRRDSAL